MRREREPPAKVTLRMQLVLPPAFAGAPAGHVPPGAVGFLRSAPGLGRPGLGERNGRAPAGLGCGGPARGGRGGRAGE